MRVPYSYHQDLNHTPITATHPLPNNSTSSTTTPYFPATTLALKTPFSHHPHHPLQLLHPPTPPRSNRYRCAESLSCPDSDEDDDDVNDIEEEDGIGIRISKIGKRARRIESSVAINARLEDVWGVLTDYDNLADFLPGLAVSRLVEKRGNCARLFQLGQQNLALGLKFNAKAVLDCYEKDIETISIGRRRDIEFKMVEGDFDLFEGKWSIEEYDAGRCESSQILDLLEGQEFRTILSYVLEAKPKLWLPVRLVEGRLCTEIKTNLSCVRQEAHLRLPSSCS